ncbi:hypothetical protein C8R46DRAFT_992734 [Mycena filopes]|nr:hypothetical protein C8R46DRAFT_992734 [Mycena filopes]
MASFLVGDELGNIKSLKPTISTPQAPSTLSLLHSGKSSVNALSVASTSKSVAAAYADGSVAAFTRDDTELHLVEQWRETRLKPNQSFVGLQATDRGIYSCTSNGALRLVPQGKGKEPLLASLPARLADWRLASDQATFAYGGDEVELSVWDTEKAMSSPGEPAGTKRKRDSLFPGELWRAKNVPNDGLGLRQPVRITSLTYLASPTHLLTGTALGDVRRYDTRHARRPVSNWKGIGKMGGVKLVEKGLADHEIFVSDHGSNLFALDLRNGRVIYSYKGLAGAVTSMAPSPSLLVSTALDRYCRIHTSFPPPPEAGQNQDNKGQVVDKVFMTSVPTVVVWDGVQPVVSTPELQGDDDEFWDEMENIGDSDDESKGKRRRRNAE